MAIEMLKGNKFEDRVKEGFTIVDFTMDKWGACVDISKVLEIMNFEIPFVKILKVSREENLEEVKKNKIMAFPTVHLYKDGEFLEEVIGVPSAEDFDKYFKKYLY